MAQQRCETFLVDLGHCEGNDDQFNILQPLLNASQEQVPTTREISAQVGGGEARIVTEAVFEGGVLTTSYALDLVDPEALRIRSELRLRGVAEDLIARELDIAPEVWLERLRLVHERKYGSVPPADRKDLARRIRFLESRGFGAELIQRLLRER